MLPGLSGSSLRAVGNLDGRKWIIVDDTDTAIVYRGPWSSTDGSKYANSGNFGQPYNNTLHGINATGSLSFSYDGSSARLTGTLDLKNNSGVLDPTWECFIDQKSAGTKTPKNAHAQNNQWLLCDWSDLDLLAGQHVVTVNISSNGQAFWFDQIYYLSNSHPKLEGSTLFVGSNDPEVSLDSAWTPLDEIGYMTQTAGATAKFKFTGSRVTWVGMIPRELPSASTSATYSVDNQAPVRFTLPGLSPSQNYSQFNHIFFQTDFLAPKSHELVVKYEGDANTTPLVLGSFLVDGFSSESPKKSVPIGPIVGAVIGGIALIIILFFAIIRFKYRKLAYKPVLIEEPFHYIKPFTLTRAHDPYSDAASYNPYNLSTSTLNHEPADPNRVSPYPFTSPTAVATSYQPGAQLNVPAPAPMSRQARKQALVAESATATSSRLVMHQDSGMRLPNATPEDIGLGPGYPAQGTAPRF
ncbi:hypothetical protein MD484_g4472, partial [Candolleomyces efflorescens]